MLKTLTNGDYFLYKLEQGGGGIVRADSPTDAVRKVREAYRKHSSADFTEGISVYDIYQVPFDDCPDVLEIEEV